MYLRRIGKTDCVPNGSHVGAKVVFSFFKGAFKVFYLWNWDMFHRLLFLHVCYRNVEWSSVVLPMDFVCQNIEFGFQPVRHLTRPSFFYLLVSMNDFPRNVCTCGGKNYWVRRRAAWPLITWIVASFDRGRFSIWATWKGGREIRRFFKFGKRHKKNVIYVSRLVESHGLAGDVMRWKCRYLLRNEHAHWSAVDCM